MNMHLRVLTLALGVCVSLVGTVSAQPGSAEAIVRDTYRRYLKREPNRAEIATWSQVLARGTTPDELRGLFLGADEYFRSLGNDPRTWFVTVFKELTGRNPSEDEIRYWLAQVNGLGEAERRQLIRLMMAPPPAPTAQVPEPARPGPQPLPLPGNVARAPDLADRLIVLARRFVADTQVDLGNSAQGRRLVTRGDALIGASERFRDTFDRPLSAEQRGMAFNDVLRAYRALQDELIGQPNTTPTAGPVADRIGAILRDLRRLDFQNQSESALPVRVPTDRLWRLTAIIGQENRNLLAFLRSVNPPNAYTNGLLRYAEQFDARINAFRARVPGEDDSRTLELAFQPVRDQAQAIDRLVAHNSLYPTIDRHWGTIRGEMEQVAEAVGARVDSPILPERPSEGTLKSVPQLPLPSGSGTANQAAVTAADEALTALDAYLSILEPKRTPAELLTGVRALRADLTRLRRAAADGALRPLLRSGLDEVNLSYDRLRSRLATAARQNPSLDSFQFHTVGETIERLRRTVL